jgi:3-oxoacyl-[acyl-carrier protein] reductase
VARQGRSKRRCQITKGGKARAFKAEVNSPAQARNLIRQAVEAPGAADILQQRRRRARITPLEAIDEAHVHSALHHNIDGTIFVTQAAAEHLARSQSGGRVVNVSAIASHHSLPGFSMYAAGKAALNALTRTWALELGPKGITVIAVAPGPVDTEMYRSFGLDEEASKYILSRHPLGRIALPADIADAVAFLASPDGRWITGQMIDTAGGFLPWAPLSISSSAAALRWSRSTGRRCAWDLSGTACLRPRPTRSPPTSMAYAPRRSTADEHGGRAARMPGALVRQVVWGQSGGARMSRCCRLP